MEVRGGAVSAPRMIVAHGDLMASRGASHWEYPQQGGVSLPGRPIFLSECLIPQP